MAIQEPKTFHDPSNGESISDASPALPTEAIRHSEPAVSEPSANANMRKNGRGGAPKSNANAMRHGLRGSKLPRGARPDEAMIADLCRATQSEFEAKHGRPMGVVELAIVHRLRRAATKDRLAARWLRQEADKLTIEQRLSLVDASATAAEAIEKCLARLGLTLSDGAEASAGNLADLYRQPRVPALNEPEKPGRFSGQPEPPNDVPTEKAPHSPAEATTGQAKE